ncbi:hypothetical protein [Allohahella sp. A8]|uniref:hypothetical protein n=1 Tax=Allohahella sp. A8 TaxID=3141461 RepID=UPI003A80FA91
MTITEQPMFHPSRLAGQLARLILLALAFTAVLAACSDDSKKGGTALVDPEDELPEGSIFAGRVIDGYLRNAFVWMDLNANDAYEVNEPSAETGKFGLYSFTEEQLAGIENPGAYPLLAFVEAGKATDEDLIPFNAAGPEEEAGGLVLRSYTLKAPPGVRFITPFSTLTAAYIAQQAADNAADPAFVAPDFRTAGTAVSALLKLNTNLLRDYVAESERKLHAYAKATTVALQAEIEKLVEAAGNSTPGSREVIDALPPEIVRSSHLALLADVAQWLPVANRYAEKVLTPGNLLGMPLRRIERHMRLALGVDNPLAVSKIQWFAGNLATSSGRTDLESNQMNLTSISSGGVDIIETCEDSSNLACERFAETDFTYGVFGRVLQQKIFGAIELQFVPHPVFGFQPLTTFRPESTELSRPAPEPEVKISYLEGQPAVESAVSGARVSVNTREFANRLFEDYTDIGIRADDDSIWEVRIGSEGESCVAYSIYYVETEETSKNPNGSTTGCLDYLWRFSFDAAGRIINESVVQLSPFKVYRVTRAYDPAEGDEPTLLRLQNISMQADRSVTLADPSVRAELLGGLATSNDPLEKLDELTVSARKIEAAIPAEEPAGTAERFQRIVEVPTLDAESVQAGLAQLAPQFSDLFGFNPIGIIFNDSAEACGAAPAGAEAVTPVEIASFNYVGDQLASVCRPNLGCPVNTDQSPLTASWCWHLQYEGERPTAAFLEEIPANASAQGPTNGKIVMLQRFQYEPLIDLLDDSAKNN